MGESVEDVSAFFLKIVVVPLYLKKKYIQRLLWARSFIDKILHLVDSIVDIPQTSSAF